MATLTYRIGRRILRTVLPLWVRVESEGFGRLPARGPFLLCPNHLSVLDPLILAALSSRPLTFLAAGYLFEMPVVGTVLRAGGALPIGGAARTRNSLVTALHVLESGGAVGIFPEGGVREDLSPSLGRGVGFLALRSGAPLYPVLIRGTGQILPTGHYLPRRGVARVTVGERVEYDRDWSSGRVVEELSEKLQKMKR